MAIGSLFFIASTSHGDAVPGVDRHVRNAQAILLIQAQTAADSQKDPAPPGKLRAQIREVLKGFYAPQSLLLDAGTLSPGQKALVLIPYNFPAHYQPAIATKRDAPDALNLWPIAQDDALDTHGTPLRTQDGKAGHPDAVVRLGDVRGEIKISSPEEIGLQTQMLEALLTPRKFEVFAKSHPGRAKYVQFVLAVRDLRRDIPSLAALVESEDPELNAAVQDRLIGSFWQRSHIGAGIPSIDPSSPAPKRRAQSDRWLGFWEQERKNLRWDNEWRRYERIDMEWDDVAKKYVHRDVNLSPRERAWPAAPPAGEPVAGFDPNLLDGLEHQDADQFTRAFMDWLDSGVLRDRAIYASRNITDQLRNAYNVTGAIGGSENLPPAPRLTPQLLFDDANSTEQRMQVIALIVQLWHFDRFARERAEAIAYLQKTDDIDAVMRAAQWEMRDVNLVTAGAVACQRLAERDDLASQDFLSQLFINKVDDAMLSVAGIEIRAQRKPYINALLQYVASHRDESAGWAGRILCVEKQPAVIPLLIPWLKDPDADVRKTAALDLCFQPGPDSVAPLLLAISQEPHPEVKQQMVTALAETGDKRALLTLLGAIEDKDNDDSRSSICRGLARVGDARALPALAKLATSAQDMDTQLRWEAVRAFGRISGRFKAAPPPAYGSNDAVDPEILTQGAADIKRWQINHAGE